MSKKQREKVEDEVRFHRAQLVRPGCGGNQQSQPMTNNTNNINQPTMIQTGLTQVVTASTTTSPNGGQVIQQGSPNGSTIQPVTISLHGQLNSSSPMLAATAGDGNPNIRNGTHPSAQQHRPPPHPQATGNSNANSNSSATSTSNYHLATSQQQQETSPDSSVLEQQPPQQPSSSSQHVSYSSLTNG